VTDGNGLSSVDHVVVLMLENRSSDHLLGFLYPGNASATNDQLYGSSNGPARAGEAAPGVTAPPPPGPLSA
jgi:phospholipase C